MRVGQKFCVLGLAVAATMQPALAKLMVTWSAGFASWQATNIVLVETTAIGGSLDVVESWKGDLPAGSQIVIPQLAPGADARPISEYPMHWDLQSQKFAEQIPRQPVGSRMVLFLKKGEKGNEWIGWSPGDGTNSMMISTVWIDGNHTFYFGKAYSSGPLVLSILGGVSREERRFVASSEEDLKRDVMAVLRVQEDMKDAVAEKMDEREH